MRAAKAAGKPVVVSMGTYAASGGYWISAEADHIVAQPSTLMGSIGVFGGKMVLRDALARAERQDALAALPELGSLPPLPALADRAVRLLRTGRSEDLQRELAAVIAEHSPDRAACEEVFVNKNPQSTLKLAQARGAALAACGTAGLEVREHAARAVKKAVVGTGAAEKTQVQAMLKVLLPGVAVAGADAADALAVAIADAHSR